MEESDAEEAVEERDAAGTDDGAGEDLGDAVDGAASDGEPRDVAGESASPGGEAAGDGAPEAAAEEVDAEAPSGGAGEGGAARDGDSDAIRDGEPDGAAVGTDRAQAGDGVGAAADAADGAAADGAAAPAGGDGDSAGTAAAAETEPGDGSGAGRAAAAAAKDGELGSEHDDGAGGDGDGGGAAPDGEATEGRVYGSDDVRKYDRFKKIESSEYDRVNDFLRKRTYVTAREWAIARLCTDFRTETGVEMTLIGENLPELVPFMTDTYSPQAVNQARSSFVDKVKKAGSTFLYGSMSGFFTTEELDDVMYEVTETARFLLEVEGAEIAAEHEMEVEDRISDAMRQIQEGSAALRAEEKEHTCPHCGEDFTEDEEP